MNARASKAEAGTADVSASAMGVVGTAVFAVLTLGATVTVFAAFIALLVGGCAGARGLFALVTGSMAFATLSLVQFLCWAGALLQSLRGRS